MYLEEVRRMGRYDEQISDASVWITATPTELTKTLPFYISEAGHFWAEKDYGICRERHDSFLMLYTIEGKGYLQTGNTEMQLGKKETVIIDCHFPHKYGSLSETWEFLWIHFNGASAATMFGIIYSSQVVCTVKLDHVSEFERRMKSLVENACQNNITGCSDISLRMHLLMNTICAAALEKISDIQLPDNDIRLALNFMEEHYQEQITIDDIIRDIPVSKYHFIRLFRRVMGITPYQYLVNYRINMSKMFLRSTDRTVTEIAERCGFLDTSNFIMQFKKHTGQRPLGYRKDFA